MCGNAAVFLLVFKREDELVADLRIALDKLGIGQEDMLLRIKEGEQTDNLAVFADSSGLVLVGSVFAFVKAHSRIVDDLLHLDKLRRARVHIDHRADDLAFFCVFFFICGSERGLDGFDYFRARYAALLLELAQHRVHYFEIEHSVCVMCNFGNKKTDPIQDGYQSMRSIGT